MIGRTGVGALVAASSMLVPLSSAHACRFLDRCCGRAAPAPTTTYYAPVAAAPACCPQQQVVNYMPQTCYRTVYVNQPVVSYRPTTACDACGRATTVMRPVTTYVARPQLVPYTTYRPVATTVARPCCAAPTTTYYAPPVQVAPAAPAAPCCTPVSVRTVTPAPAAVPYNPAPVSAPVPAGGTLQETTPVPTLDTVPPSTPQQTYSPLDSNPAQSRIVLPPNGDSSSTLGRPRGLDPQHELDRTTAIPLRRTTVHQASLTVGAAPQAPAADDGWRAGK